MQCTPLLSRGLIEAVPAAMALGFELVQLLKGSKFNISKLQKLSVIKEASMAIPPYGIAHMA